MSDIKVSALTAADDVDDADLFHLVKGGVDKKATAAQMRASITAAAITNALAGVDGTYADFLSALGFDPAVNAVMGLRVYGDGGTYSLSGYVGSEYIETDDLPFDASGADVCAEFLRLLGVAPIFSGAEPSVGDAIFTFSATGIAGRPVSMDLNSNDLTRAGHITGVSAITVAGAGYAADQNLSIQGPFGQSSQGQFATAVVATVSGGAVTGVTITDGGFDYVPATDYTIQTGNEDVTAHVQFTVDNQGGRVVVSQMPAGSWPQVRS